MSSSKANWMSCGDMLSSLCKVERTDFGIGTGDRRRAIAMNPGTGEGAEARRWYQGQVLDASTEADGKFKVKREQRSGI
jgi:hypothetical protein